MWWWSPSSVAVLVTVDSWTYLPHHLLLACGDETILWLIRFPTCHDDTGSWQILLSVVIILILMTLSLSGHACADETFSGDRYNYFSLHMALSMVILSHVNCHVPTSIKIFLSLLSFFSFAHVLHHLLHNLQYILLHSILSCCSPCWLHGWSNFIVSHSFLLLTLLILIVSHTSLHSLVWNFYPLTLWWSFLLFLQFFFFQV